MNSTMDPDNNNEPGPKATVHDDLQLRDAVRHTVMVRTDSVSSNLLIASKKEKSFCVHLYGDILDLMVPWKRRNCIESA